MEINEILELIQAVSDSELTGFQYEEDGVKLSFKKEKKMIMQPVVAAGNQLSAIASDSVVTGNSGVSVEIKGTENTLMETFVSDKKENSAEIGKIVTSPLVGTFYVAPAEDEKAFVNVGDTVKQGQVLAIVEAMKLMNEIESEFDGVVAEVLVENGQMVEYGQPLFRIV